MRSNWIGALVVVATICTTGRGDVIFQYEPLVLIKDEPTEVTLALIGSGDSEFGVGALHWVFSVPQGVHIGDYTWDPVTFAAREFFLATDPIELVWEGDDGESPARITSHTSLVIGTVEVTANQLGGFELRLDEAGALADSGVGFPLEIKKGSDVAQFQVVPEPSSILLVGFGGLWALRRRR